MRRIEVNSLVAGALVLAALSLNACSPVGVAVGAGTTVGVAAAEERGVSGAASDAQIRAEVNHLWFQYDLDMFKRVGLQIYERRVLLTGYVPTERMRDDAVRLAWQPGGVREVINEIRIEDGTGLGTAASDKWITTQVKSKLLFAKGVQAINYSTRTVDGTVYLLGLAQSEEELDRVFEVVRNVPNVRKVISHVLLRDDLRRYG